MSRRAEIERNTKETKIKIALELDGTGKAELHSGIGFFDFSIDAVPFADRYIGLCR